MIQRIRNNLIIRNHQIYVLNHTDEIKKVSANIPITITVIDNENVIRVLDFRESHHLNRFKEFLSNSDIGVYAWHNDVVIGHLWAALCPKKKCRINGYFDLKKNEALFHYGNVNPQYRGNNILAAMSCDISKYLFNNNVSRIYADPDVNNIASKESFEKMGYKNYGKLRYVQYNYRLLWKRKLR